MANKYINIPVLVSVSTITAVYTVPASTTAVVRSISVYNTDSSGMDVLLSVYDNSVTTSFDYDKKTSLAATTKFEFLNSDNSNVLILEESDKLQVTCSTTGGLNIMLSILEMSRT